MSFLNLDGGSGSDQIVGRLIQEHKRRSAKSVGFDAVDVDEAILQAAVLLFRDRQQQHQQEGSQQRQQQEPQRVFSIDSGRKRPNQTHGPNSSPRENQETPGNVKLEKLCINNCPANPYLEYLIEAAMGMDLFEEFELQGNMEEELLKAELEAEKQREVAYAAQREREQRARESSGQNDETDGNEDGGQDLLEEAPMEEEPDGDGGDENDEEPIDETAVTQAPTPSPSSNIFALDALGFRLRFSRRLRKLELVNLPITRDHAESLMYGIETNVVTGTGCRLDTLVMEGVRFVHDEEEGDENDAMEEDGGAYDEYGNPVAVAEEMPTSPGDGTVVVKELCEGFPNNCTLKRIDLQRCSLTDAQIGLIFDSLANHPTLTSINLSENACRKLGLEALDRMLVSPQWMPQAEAAATTSPSKSSDDKHYCKIESLDLGYQFTSEENYGTGEHIQLDILTRNCTTQDADIRIYPNLRKLVLQGNQIWDSDMKDLAFLIRHRFHRLEELDLRFNEITTEGLEIFANHSDPNNDCYRSYFDGNNGTNGETNHTYRDQYPPPSSRLRTIRLTNNPLNMTDETSSVILKLLKIYPELQQIQSNLSWEETPNAEDIQHLLDINRAGRVLLLAGCGSVADSPTIRMNGNSNLNSNSDSSTQDQRRRQLRQQQLSPVPVAAWPLVLGRLTRQTHYPHYIPKKNCLNGMYYLIRHGPIIMEQMTSRANRKPAAAEKKQKMKYYDEKKEEHDRKRQRGGDPALGGGYATLDDFLNCELGRAA